MQVLSQLESTSVVRAKAELLPWHKQCESRMQTWLSIGAGTLKYCRVRAMKPPKYESHGYMWKPEMA